ncbi:hypothetical protein PoB_007417500 [Plakobranchus ocellatus]|uniref:SMB domain-containing protein n=1 Tax=Plakobranchus ocellatus TaxID=259542 RepID=A0AAV4DUF2_9GAST|nr:hypothetical protein PoB_007417500 [Plakobranchus ocellatus]
MDERDRGIYGTGSTTSCRLLVKSYRRHMRGKRTIMAEQRGGGFSAWQSVSRSTYRPEQVAHAVKKDLSMFWRQLALINFSSIKTGIKGGTSKETPYRVEIFNTYATISASCTMRYIASQNDQHMNGSSVSLSDERTVTEKNDSVGKSRTAEPELDQQNITKRKPSASEDETQTFSNKMGILEYGGPGNEDPLHNEACNSNCSLTFSLITEQSVTVPTLRREDLQEHTGHIFSSLWSLKTNSSDPTKSPHESAQQEDLVYDAHTVNATDSVLEDPLNESCYQRCGDVASFPCSCEVRCVVHNNCCKDLAQTCPTLYNLALHKFRHLHQAAVRCDEVEAIFVIDSCPRKEKRFGKRTLDSGSSPVNISEQKRSSQNSASQYIDNFALILDIAQAAPVTDINTGITYANSSIYECNKLLTYNLSAQSENSAKRTWSVGLGSLESSVPSSLSEFQQKIDLMRFSYIPPSLQPSLSGVMCYNEKVLSCISRLSKSMANHVTCNVSAREYYEIQTSRYPFTFTKAPLEAQTCAWCVFEYRHEKYFNNRYPANGFRISAFMSDSTGKVVFDHRERSQRLLLPWSSWACEASSPPTTKETKSACQVLKCDTNFVLTPEGECKRMAFVGLALQTSFELGNKRCNVNIPAFLVSAQCYLQTFYRLRSLEEPSKISTSFDEERQVNITTVGMTMYMEESSYETGFMALLTLSQTIYTATDFFGERLCFTAEEMARLNLMEANVDLNQSAKDAQKFSTRGKSLSKNNPLEKATGKKRLQRTRNGQIVENALVQYCIKLNTYDIDLSLGRQMNCDLSSAVYPSRSDQKFLSQLKASQCVQDKPENQHFNGSRSPSCLYSILVLTLAVASSAVQKAFA